MKEKHYEKDLPSDSDLGFSFLESYDNQEIISGEDEEDNFYSFSGEDYNDLGRDKLE